MSISRRKLLATGGNGLLVGGAGCLGGWTGSDDPDDETTDDERDEDNQVADEQADVEENGEESDAMSDVSPPARWITASITDEMYFTYSDLETVRAHDDVLPAETVEEVPFLPGGAGGRIVGRLESEPSFESILEFGPTSVGGYHVMRGEFDLAGLDTGAPVDEVGAFEVFETATASVAASNDTLVVTDPEVSRLDEVLAAGVEGTDRRSDAGDSFETMLEHVSDAAVSVGVFPDSTVGGRSIGRSWSVSSETVSSTRVVISDAVSDLSEDELRAQVTEESDTNAFESVSVDIEDDTAIIDRTLPASEYRYVDNFRRHLAGTSIPVRATVAIDVRTATQSVAVDLREIGRTARVEVRDRTGTRATLTERGETATLEYDVGDSATVTVAVVTDERESVITTESVEF